QARAEIAPHVFAKDGDLALDVILRLAVLRQQRSAVAGRRGVAPGYVLRHAQRVEQLVAHAALLVERLEDVAPQRLEAAHAQQVGARGRVLDALRLQS